MNRHRGEKTKSKLIFKYFSKNKKGENYNLILIKNLV